MQNFGVTNKEHYGMLWYFLEWSIARRSVASSYQGSNKGAEATATLLVVPLINGRCHF